MKQSVRITLILVTFLVLFSCKKESLSKHDGSLYLISVTSCFQEERQIRLSEIADTIEYLELKTPDSIVVTNIHSIIPVEDFLLVKARMVLYKFTKDGQLIQTIGTRGQGPGEYVRLYEFDVDTLRREIMITDDNKIHFYDYDGNYLRMQKSGIIVRFALQDSMIWSCCFRLHTYPYSFVVLSAKGDTLRTFPNPFYAMNSKNGAIQGYESTLQREFYRYGNSLYAKGKADQDTVYRIEGLELAPHIIFQLGSLDLPLKYQPWYDWEAFQKNAMNYWQVPAVFEDDRYIYATVQRARWDDDGDDFRYVLYDKRERKGFVQKRYSQQKIEDDILGCIDFWPRFESEDYFYDVIEWYNLEKMLEEGHYMLKPELQKQFDMFDYGTNELIIRCKKKKTG